MIVCMYLYRLIPCDQLKGPKRRYICEQQEGVKNDLLVEKNMTKAVLDSLAILQDQSRSLSYYGCMEVRMNGNRRLDFIDRIHPLHTASQMYLLNLHPPQKYYDTANDPSVVEIDALIRLEHIDDGMAQVRQMYPDLMKGIPKHLERVNQRSNGTVEDAYPCWLAWAIHDYYIQDFVCLGYEMPAECMKEECRR